MSPIRVAIIGLSSSAKTTWAADAHLPYLLSSRGKAHYEIVALLNSSVKAAEAARAHFKLPASVKAYGDPKALAADPDIDLVVCCTRVDTHFPTVEPSVKAGKAVYVEWPLTENYVRAVTLFENGRSVNSSIAGVQGRVSPIVLKLKEILASGRIGKVLSSDVRAFGNLLPRATLPEGLAYFAEREVGGNPITIAYAHMIDYVHEVLGEFHSFESRMQIQRPKVTIIGEDGKEIGTKTSNVPDLLVVHGELAKGKQNIIVNGATLSVMYRSGTPFKNTSPFTWTINGEKGEVMVTGPMGPYLHSDSYGDEPIRIQIHDHASDEVVDVPFDWKVWQKELPIRARIVGEVYERYARWSEAGKGPIENPAEDEWPRVRSAVARLKELETVFEQYDKQFVR